MAKEDKKPEQLTGNPTDQSWINILDIADPTGDDHGPGTYLYPTNPQFNPHEGLFDIEHFKVDARGDHMRFQITFGTITNPWKMPYGFSHQLIQIYIDHRPGGSRSPFYPGANIVFSPKAPWDTMLKATGRGIYLHHANDEPPTEPELYGAGKLRVLEDQKTIEITLPMGSWINMDALTDASFYLLVGGQDGFGPDNFRVVKEDNHEWYFSGGDGSGYGPNIIDTVTPKGKNQQQVLGSFDPRMKLLAVLEPVHRPNPVRLGLVYFVAALVGFLLWYGWRKRDKFIKEQ